MRHRLRGGGALGLLAVVIGSVLTLAPPAQADSMSPGCAALASGDLDGVYAEYSTSDLEFWAGDRVVVIGGEGIAVVLEVPAGNQVDAAPDGGTMTYLFGSDTTTTLVWGSVPVASVQPPTTWEVSCSGPTRGVADTDWLQAYGRSGPDEECPVGYNPPWAGGPSAAVIAYAPSWNVWMNEGTGGWVCTRTVAKYGG